MKKIYIFQVLIVLFIFSVLIVIGYLIKDKNSNYHSLEHDMEESALVYYKNNEINLAAGESIKIKLKELIDAELVENDKVNDDICDGYVLVTKKRKNYKYKAYIKCKNYETYEE